MTPAKLRENLVVVSLSQQKLREQVEGLVARMNSRLVEPDPAFLKIAELMPKAAEEMKAAEKQLQAQAADAALPPENRALQQLQKAEEEYEKEVSSQRGGGGEGGGGAGSISEHLADLFKDLYPDPTANVELMANLRKAVHLSLSRFMVHETFEARRPPRWLVARALACSPARPRSWLSSV